MNTVSVNITSGRRWWARRRRWGCRPTTMITRSMQPEAGEADDDAGGDHLRDVAVHVVADLVGEDDFDFVGREFVEQRVAHQHAARAAEAGEHGVGFRGVGAEAEAVDAFDREAGAVGEALHAVDQARRFRAARFCRTAA